MMKRKIVKTALSFCLILAVCLSFCTGFSAENAGYLTISGKTVYQTDSLARVSELFGAPKLSTPSLFGGVANTYYSENYSDFLFLETNAKNEIVVLATVTPGYKTSKLGESYGEDWSGIISMIISASDIRRIEKLTPEVFSSERIKIWMSTMRPPEEIRGMLCAFCRNMA